MVIDASTIRTIADRNIFDPNRIAHSPNAPQTHRQREPDSFSLVGTMSYEKGDFAFFDGTSPEFHKAAQLDDSIATYKIAAIEHDSVTLAKDTNEIVLALGDQMRDDGTGKFVPAPGNAGASASSLNRSRRNGRFSFRRNRTGFNRGGTNTGGASRSNVTAPDNNQPPSPDDNMNQPDDNTPQDNVIIVPVDPNGQVVSPDQTPATP